MTDGAKATVVVANLDATVCEVLARVVEAAGHEAVRVTDPTQVSAAVLSAPADALVLDLESANVDQLRSLRGGDHPRSTSCRVITITTGPANSLLAWQADTDAVLSRPFRAEELQATVADVLGRSDVDRRSMRITQIHALSS